MRVITKIEFIDVKSGYNRNVKILYNKDNPFLGLAPEFGKPFLTGSLKIEGIYGNSIDSEKEDYQLLGFNKQSKEVLGDFYKFFETEIKKENRAYYTVIRLERELLERKGAMRHLVDNFNGLNNEFSDYKTQKQKLLSTNKVKAQKKLDGVVAKFLRERGKLNFKFKTSQNQLRKYRNMSVKEKFIDLGRSIFKAIKTALFKKMAQAFWLQVDSAIVYFQFDIQSNFIR